MEEIAEVITINQSKPYLADKIFQPYKQKPAKTRRQTKSAASAEPVHPEKAINENAVSHVGPDASFLSPNFPGHPDIVHINRQKFIDIPKHIYQHSYQDVVVEPEDSGRLSGLEFPPVPDNWW